MATWILGDLHGCADELEQLLERLALGPDDTLVACGDLFHRGPAPLAVARLLREARARFVLGNHEHVLLARNGRTPARDGSVPGVGCPAPALPGGAATATVLAGDGGAVCEAPPERGAELLDFLTANDGYHLSSERLPGAGTTPDGRPFVVVHAGREPGVALEETSRRTLLYARRLGGRGAPWWYERYSGPELVLFGHTPSRRPRSRFAGGRLVALGLDTGCVYGGALTAYCPEHDALESVPARRAWADAYA